MENKENIEEIEEILQKFNKIHYTSGPIHQRIERLKAFSCIKNNELEAIYHLVESHVPSLRLKAILRYEKILTSAADNAQLSLSKNHVSSNCANTKIAENINAMLGKIEEMPSEWTIVQLTPRFNPKENIEIDVKQHYTNSLYISVFNCGVNQPEAFCIQIEAPQDNISGSPINFHDEINSIIYENKTTLISSKKQTHFIDVTEKHNYYQRRQSVDSRLQLLVKDLQNLYLKEWRCLMIGKYINNEYEVKISQRIKDFIKATTPWFHLDDRTKNILQYLIKGASYLKITEMRNAIHSIIPDMDKKLQKNLAVFIRNLSDDLQLFKQKRHPVILVIDDSLDCFPWEMMDVLVDEPVSRLPSLHLAYALFKEHQATIRNGFKIIEKPENGTFIVNPDLDLRNMQNRITSFFEYWTPNWKGLAGSKPTEDQFEKMLVSGDIFSYNGHGSGTHFFSQGKIERIHINAVVLLFGCGSTKLDKIGAQTEMFGTYQMYLIACSPCIVGMLWEVTDLDTDVLTTELLSQWIPNPNQIHWKYLDKSKWKKGEKVNFSKEKGEIRECKQPGDCELLRAISSAKKSNLLSFYVTKAACVARGIPVKIVTE